MRLLRCMVIAALGCLASSIDQPSSKGQSSSPDGLQSADDDVRTARDFITDRQLLREIPFVARIYDEFTFAERQFIGLGTILALAPYLRLVLVAVFAMALAMAINLYLHSVVLISSGRGELPEDWEWDYSVWLQQLEKDLEYAWADK